MPNRIDTTTRVFDLPTFELAETDREHNLAYPYPPLLPTGVTEARSVELIVIENDWLIAEIAPSLGGRLVRLFDKRSESEIVPPIDQWSLAKRGPRRHELPGGIEIGVGPGYRPNTLGPVDFQMDDDSVVWHERILGTPLSFHSFVSASENSAEIDLEVRALNRSLYPQAYTSWLSIGINGEAHPNWIYDSARKVGCALFFEPSPSVVWKSRTDGGQWGRFQEGVCEWLGPRQLDTWAVRLFPISGLGQIDNATPFGAIEVQSDQFHVVAFRPESRAKVFVLTLEGETLESVVDFDPLKITRVNLPAQAVVIRAADGTELLAFDRRSPKSKSVMESLGSVTMAALRQAQNAHGESRETRYFEGLALLERDEEATDCLSQALVVPALKSAASVALGIGAVQRQDWKSAGMHFDEALTTNPEDHLSWWLKSLVMRIAGEEPGDERSNAHFLAPLEPLLRAEAFLASPIGMPSALVESIKNDIEALVEGGCALIELRLYDQAARWIEEALRHTDSPRLRYLMAFCHLKGSKMAFEAAQHVLAAEEQAIEPPYPWQSVELKAIRCLLEHFTDSDRLIELNSLIGG